MKKYSFKRYAGVTMALFGAAALSLLLFFALFRIDAIHKADRKSVVRERV